MKRYLQFLLILCLSIQALTVVSAQELTILFTHDLHDHIEPFEVLVEDEVVEFGGYERINEVIQSYRDQDQPLLVLDAGDYSMGTLYQTIYATTNPSLQLLGQMGFDATTFGNHEFDYQKQGFLDSLVVAKDQADQLPALLAANISTADSEVKQVFDELEVKPYQLFEQEGMTIAVFGLIGEEAISNAPMAGIDFIDPIQAAKETVAQIQEEGADLIIALSHSGTSSNPKRSEDEQLAKEVPEIDVIISGHSHTTLEEPLVVGDTLIASSGHYGQAIGELTLDVSDDKQLVNYTIIPLTQTVTTDHLTESIDRYKEQVQADYLDHFDLEFDEELAYLPFNFTSVRQLGQEHREEPLGNLIADAFRHQLQTIEQETSQPVIAVVPYGTIRDSLTEGPLTVSDIFNVNSLGIGPDGLSGYPLLHVYLTGADLKTVAEVDASIAPLQPIAQLYTSGLQYDFNPRRLIFNKITDVYLTDLDGKRIEIIDDELYSVVAGLYTGQMLSLVTDESFGLLSITPRDQSGAEITQLEDHIIYQDDQEVKEWRAVAEYLQTFPQEENLPTVPIEYADVDQRKVVVESNNFIDLIKHPNRMAWIIYGLLLLIISLIGLVIYFIYRRLRRNRH